MKATVRAAVMERDGPYCRLAKSRDAQRLFGECCGNTEWAHWGPWRRFNTRGQDADQRHVRHGGLALCEVHHDDYDEGRLTIEALTPDDCDGRLRYANRQGEWEEVDNPTAL